MNSRNKRDTEPRVTVKAQSLLADPLFLDKASQKVGDFGVVGEKRNRLILILAGIARTLPEPPSVLVSGSTSSGKSTLVNTSLRLFPPDCIVERAGLSGKALVHGKGSLAHKILFISEYRCGKDAQQLLRLLQSEGSIAHEYTTVRGASRNTKTAKRTGMPVVLTTTTDEEIYEDDSTRFLRIFADESPAQNQAIVLSRARGPRVPDFRDLPLWRKSMSLLTYEKGDFEHPPHWIEYVARQLPRQQVRVRRDWDRFINFCSAIALLRRPTTTTHLDISFEDYAIAYRIFEPVFASTLHNLRSQEVVLASVVARVFKKVRRAVTVGEIAKELGWRKSRVYRPLTNAVRKRLVRYEDGTRERNVKRVLPIDEGVPRFLPSPRSVLKNNPELGGKVKYVDPFGGKRKVIRK
jgi:hypothetical protein